MDDSHDLQGKSFVNDAPKFALWYHPIYTAGLHPDARFPRDRYELLLARLESSKAHGSMTIKTPEPIDKECLLLAHGEDYVERFLTDNLSEKEEKRIGLTPWTPDMIRRTLCLMGGALEATEYAVLHGGFSGNMAGGTHHAHRDFGSGYCVFNDLAVSALHAVQNLGVRRVAILDLDVHQGDGTATILAQEERICTISVHCSTNFPFRKSISDHDLAIPAQAEDDLYLEMVVEALETCMAFEPDLVLYQAGVDALEADALGKLNVSRRGMQRRNQLVFEAVHQRKLPLVIFMGGGYAKPIDASIDAFFDLFTDAATWPRNKTLQAMP
ncbi:MAG: histone deacetylase [Candidatus Poseidoniales archaeon]|nr:MAG: histone deacetylase [Candidatus Poseidoniales archaeon]